MRLAALLLGCLPFVLLEIGMRMFVPPPAVAEGIDNDPIVDLHQLRPLFVHNERADRWEIPPERYNYFRPASFPAAKSATTKRIFVLGGSTVQGRPYEHETAFSTWLKLQLQSANPAVQFEVINCGGVSYASYRVAKILNEILKHQPDAVVLYTGHNEFLEDRSYASIREMTSSRQWIARLATHVRTVQWLKDRFSQPPKRTELPAEVAARLDQANGLESYRRDTAWQDGVQQHFAIVLDHMVASTQQAGVPLLLCIPASDLINTPPIKTQTKPGLNNQLLDEFQSAWQQASDSEIDSSVRIQAAKRCLDIDRDHAGAHYLIGRLLYEIGDTTAARDHLVRARDADVCPLRATTSIINTLQRIAAENNLPVIDVITLLDQRNRSGDRVSDGIPDPQSFVDHVHPTIAGHQIIGDALAKEFQRLDWVTLTDQSKQRFQASAQSHLSSLGEDYYERGKQRLAGLHQWASGRAHQMGTSLDNADTARDAKDQSDDRDESPR
ncbi:MAG: SGNH/GDSL hydrolase family protein [Pirellulaceae bacterium]|nr:SGNH/GDSL hydrolase family protein [Pirellulaceae bacterium]